ncbi:bifunctional diguanylate cyclase/phosphodiesterase [Yoonia sp. BS5-3]|uniref:EAL domain-containing protein n=1 Tax=Yoonia phaeophyticola TaxID=3137369 RepID=A0ABZ2V404_9RHOB
MDRIAQNASEAVLQACGVKGVAIWHRFFGHLGGATCPKAINKDAIYCSLEELLDARSISENTDASHTQCVHTDLALAAYPLAFDDQQIGWMALAIDAADFDAFHAEKGSHISDLTAMLLARSHISHQLEADLAVAHDHAKRLTKIAETDQLTKLENKASFEKKCKARLTNDLRPAAMLAFDLDDFKKVNDLYGHPFGDQYLKTIAATLKVTLPKGSIIGRTGGDEFCALVDIPDSGRAYLQSVIRHTNLAIKRGIATLGKVELGALSTGVSTFPDQATQFHELLRMSDCALYAAKRSDQVSATVYSSDMSTMLEPATKFGGPNDFEIQRITTHFQPIYDVANGKCQGLEILARMPDQNGTLLGPSAFSWVFRDYRLAAGLTAHILDTALEQLFVEACIDVRDVPDIWLNVTDNDCLNTDFIFDIQAVLSRYKLSWDHLVIEINEDTMVKSRNGVVPNLLREIRLRGGRVALDDFGAGRTGLTHACQWPVDIIKIDRSIMQELATNERTETMVDALTMVAARLKQKVVAEGIETQEQLELARHKGACLAQGFALSRPMSITQLQDTAALIAC